MRSAFQTCRIVPLRDLTLCHAGRRLQNPGEDTANITARWDQVDLPPGTTATVVDLWTTKSSQLTELTAEMPSHGGVLVTATVVKQLQ